jgi:predicted Fe-Mo cluster-binding NifX family protein
MKLKIAIPVNETGNLDPHFGHCRYFAIYLAEGGKIVSDETIQPPPHEPGILPQWLAGLEVTHVLTGGMGNRAIQLFNQNNIQVYTGAPVLHSKDLANGFLENNIRFSGNHCDH